jgi:hypothetical protein
MYVRINCKVTVNSNLHLLLQLAFSANFNLTVKSKNSNYSCNLTVIPYTDIMYISRLTMDIFRLTLSYYYNNILAPSSEPISDTCTSGYFSCSSLLFQRPTHAWGVEITDNNEWRCGAGPNWNTRAV